jgi:pimeloyl-ACP methyl ester carboxylesterase
MRKMIAMIPAALLLVSSAETASQPRNLDVAEARINDTVSGTGTAIVFIHGWALDLREWNDQVATLSKNFRVIAYDRRGYGKSTGIADASACLDFMDLMRLRPGVGHVGQPTGVDTDYMEKWGWTSRSGIIQVAYPMKVYCNRRRKNNEGYEPVVGRDAIADIESLREWIRANYKRW